MRLGRVGIGTALTTSRMRARSKRNHFVLADFPRSQSGVVWNDGVADLPVALSGLPSWQSNGGPSRGHPNRALPFTLKIDIPETADRLCQVYVIGVFALWAGAEGSGAMGGSLTIGDEAKPLVRIDLLNRRHYDDAQNLERTQILGDGSSFRAIGKVKLGTDVLRVDEMTVDVPAGPNPKTISFRDFGTPASFIIFDVILEFEPQAAAGCPFHSAGTGVSLSDLPGIIRVGDRVRFSKALDQLESALLGSPDLDEARGEALTFIAVTSAAMLEMGGGRALHRVLLQTSREFDELEELADIAKRARKIVEDIVNPTMSPPDPLHGLVDRAISIINRNYAKDLTDEMVAEQLKSSTSHFRALFKKGTGQPFHKYLIGVRLEQAKNMIVNTDMPIQQISNAVGFSSLSHFSRAFAQRFGVSPSSLRRNAE